MIIQMQLEVTGAVPSKFKVEDYSEDCVKVSALVPLDKDAGGVGRGAEVFNYKSSEDIKEFHGLDFDNRSYLADAQVEMVKKGKQTKLILKSLAFKNQPTKA